MCLSFLCRCLYNHQTR